MPKNYVTIGKGRGIFRRRRPGGSMSVRGRILLTFIILSLVVCALAGYLSFSLFRSTEKNSDISLEALENAVRLRAGALHEFLARSEEVAMGVSAYGTDFYLSHREDETREQAEERLQASLIRFLGILGKDSGIYGLCTAYEPGIFMVDGKPFDPYAYWEKGKVVSMPSDEESFHEREWYRAALPKGWDVNKKRDKRAFWTAPYVSTDTGDLMISVSTPISDAEGKIIGVALADVGLNAMDDMVTKILPMPEAAGFALHAASGLVVSFPLSPELRMKPATELPFGAQALAQARAALEGGREKLNVSWKDAQWECVAVNIGGGMTVGILLPQEKIFAESKAEKKRAAWICGLAALLLAAIIAGAVIFIMRKVVRPVRTLADYAHAIAKGDYAAKASGEFVGELAVLRDALLSMVEELERRMALSQARSEEAARQAEEARRLQQAAARQAELEGRRIGTLKEAAQALAGVSAKVSEITQSVQTQSDRIVRGAEEQLKRLEATLGEVREMEQSIAQVAENARVSAESAGQSSSLTQEGKTSLVRTVAAMGDLERKMQGLSREMNSLGEQAQAIGHIMNVISDIADQTNLLALNAAIEAARAGEAGRGFAVVADEVRKLAEKTMQATGEVESSIRTIQGTARNGMDIMREALSEVGEVSRLSQEADAVLLSATQSADGAAEQVQQIAGATSRQNRAAQSLAETVSECGAIAGDTSAQAGRTGETLQELAAQTLKLTEITSRLQQD